MIAAYKASIYYLPILFLVDSIIYDLVAWWNEIEIGQTLFMHYSSKGSKNFQTYKLLQEILLITSLDRNNLCQQSFYVNMYLLRYFYLLFTCLHASTSHLLRQKRARSAVFHKVFQYKNTKLNIAPIETIPDVLLEEDCCNHCLAKNGCVSVNYERSGLKRCELLAEDRDARNETDFVNEGYFSYYDTVRQISYFIFSFYSPWLNCY